MTNTPRQNGPPSCGVFVARAWRENDDAFRAKITYSTDLSAEHQAETEICVADPDDVRRQLDTWMLEILAKL